MSILNAKLDAGLLAAEFAVNKRIQIQDVLDGPAAEMIDQTLRRGTPWRVAYNRKDQYFTVTQDELNAMGPAAAQKLFQECVDNAKSQYQYIYGCYPIVEAIVNKKDQGHLLHTVMEELNSPYFLDFIRKVTGITSIIKADGQATLYRPGHFLKYHTDLDTKRDRRVAYVLGFTRNWEADWGGVLEFYNERGDVEAGILPRYNSLSLFSVPKPHAVTYVAPYANEGRYSITGWFSDR